MTPRSRAVAKFGVKSMAEFKQLDVAAFKQGVFDDADDRFLLTDPPAPSHMR